MVVLGRIPQPVTAPFFKVTPAVPGSFRWSGTTILIFTPAKDAPPAARHSLRGHHRLVGHRDQRTQARAALHVRLHDADGEAAIDGVVSQERALRQSRDDRAPLQSTRASADVARARHAPFPAARLVAARTGRGRTGSPARARSAGHPALRRARSPRRGAPPARPRPSRSSWRRRWDTKRYPAAPDLVVIETTAKVPPESWVRVELDGTLPAIGGAGDARQDAELCRPGRTGVLRRRSLGEDDCNPNAGDPLRMRRGVRLDDLRARMTVADITTPARKCRSSQPILLRTGTYRGGSGQTGHARRSQSAAQASRRPHVRPSGRRHAADGDDRCLDYRYLGIVENWHRQAFTSFGDGHGVWEADGGPLLPFYARLPTVTQWAAPLSTQRP